MKTKLLSCSFLGIILIVAVIATGIKSKPEFYNGQILLPDYVHWDTLIVTDADRLNESIDSTATDMEIMELLNETTEPYGTQIQTP